MLDKLIFVYMSKDGRKCCLCGSVTTKRLHLNLLKIDSGVPTFLSDAIPDHFKPIKVIICPMWPIVIWLPPFSPFVKLKEGILCKMSHLKVTFLIISLLYSLQWYVAYRCLCEDNIVCILCIWTFTFYRNAFDKSEHKWPQPSHSEMRKWRWKEMKKMYKSKHDGLCSWVFQILV